MQNVNDPFEKQLAELRARAHELLQALDANPRQRPLFVEFSGTPKSGKSTCIDIVAHFFRRTGFRILAPSEGASKRTPYYLKKDLPAFNAWSMGYALNYVLEGLYHSDKYQIVILDRGLFDALVWFELLANKGDITQEERTIIQDFILIQKWRSVIDLVFLFSADPDTSLDRETRDKLVSDFASATAMRPDFLQDLNVAYEHVQERHSGTFRAFLRVNTSASEGTTPRSTAYAVVGKILDLLAADLVSISGP